MKQIRENFLHVATVMGYMWAGWLAATDEKWYWIVIVITLTAIVHMSAIGGIIAMAQEENR